MRSQRMARVVQVVDNRPACAARVLCGQIGGVMRVRDRIVSMVVGDCLPAPAGCCQSPDLQCLPHDESKRRGVSGAQVRIESRPRRFLLHRRAGPELLDRSPERGSGSV